MKYQLVVVFLLISIFSNAQPMRSGYFNKTKIGVPFRLETSPSVSQKGHGLELHNINGWHVTSKLSAGIGVSSIGYVNPTISTYPIYGNAVYHFKESSKTLFVYGNAGYGIVFKNPFDGGLFLEVGTGINIKLGKRNNIVPELGYRFQKIGSISSEDFSLQSLSFGVGILF